MTPPDARTEALWAEAQIRKVLLRYARGIDRLDLELVRACYHPDATDSHGSFHGTVDEFVTWVDRVLRRYDATMHLLGNPLVELDGDSDLLRRRSLVDYLGSLDRFEALDPQVVLPGHGPAFTSVCALVTATRAHHERRAEEIHAHISRLVEPTAYELSRAVFPHIDGFEILLAISEVLGHVDLLVADGDVVIDLGSPTRYAST